jgi:hypothetical protein
VKACVIACAALALASCAQPDPDAVAVAATADAFLAEQRAGAWAAAFSRLHVNLQRQCGDADGLRRAVIAKLGPVQQWSFGRPEVRRYTAELSAAARGRDGVAMPIDIAFDRHDQAWAITGWSSRSEALCR